MQLRHAPPEDSVLPPTATANTSRPSSRSTGKFEIEIQDEEVDYDTAIAQTGYGKFTITVLTLMIPGVWSSGFDTSAVSMVLPIAGCDLDLTSFKKGWLNSAIYIGMVVSSFIWGYLSDTYGRKKLLTYGYFLDGISSIASAFSPSFWPLFLSKFISGIMICGPYSILMAYISEVFSRDRRDIFLLLTGMYFAAGSFIPPAIGLWVIPWSYHWNFFGLIEMYSWRIYLIVCSLPSLIAGVITCFCVESPKFLLEKGRTSEALEALRSIYVLNSGSLAESYPVKKLKLPESVIGKLKEESNTAKESKKNFVVEFFSQITSVFTPPYLWKTLFASFILSGSVAVLNGVRLILPEMFSYLASEPSTNISTSDLACSILMQPKEKYTSCDEIVLDADIYLNMMKIYAFCFFCQVVLNVSARFVKKIFIIVFSATAPGICGILIPHVSAQHVVFLAAGFISLLNIFFYCSLSVIVIMFPTSLRATCVCTILMMSRSAVLFGNLFLSEEVFSNCYFAFYICGGILLVVAAVCIFIPGPDKSEMVQQTSDENSDNTKGEP